MASLPKSICNILYPLRRHALPSTRHCVEWSRSASAAVLKSDWTPRQVKSALEQVADDGALEPDLHARLNGQTASAPAATEAEDELVPVDNQLATVAETTGIECGMNDYLGTLQLCNSHKIRDFVLLARMAERLVPSVEHASANDVVALASAFASLGALNQPLFEAIAQNLLSNDLASLTMADKVNVARAFSAQRFRHVQLFDTMLTEPDLTSASPTEALSLLHSVAFLRMDREYKDDVVTILKDRAMEPGADKLGLGPLSEIAHSIFLCNRDRLMLGAVAKLLDPIANLIGTADIGSWTTVEGLALHRRLLLLRSSMRYLHRHTYQELPSHVKFAFRKIHRMDPPARDPRPAVSFVRKLSGVLTKLRIGHFCQAERGPFMLDVVERDRKLVYECNHFDRFYMGSTEKIAPSHLQERVLKAMGYRIVQIPHWQWNKISVKKQRIEYIRMSRYYAIKDRREIAPRDESPTDVASNPLDYFGEYFFRKERPSASWSWFQPRYDASKRLVHADRAPAVSS